MRRLFRLPVSRARVGDDVDAELEFHLDARRRELEATGLAPHDAAERARREFGDVRAARAELRAIDDARVQRVHLADWLDGVRQDARFAIRSLRRAPLFLAAAVLTLALGIGADAAIFSVVDGVLLKPLPFAAPDRLVHAWPEGKVPLGAYDIIAAQSRSYDALAGAEVGREVSITGDGEPARVVQSIVTPNVFDVLGVRPAFGKGFVAADRDRTRGRVALLSDALWRTRYDADARIIGRTIALDGETYTVIGVMPAGFRFPTEAAQLWTPITADRASSDYWWGSFMMLVGRLAPNVTPEQARAEAKLVFPRAREGFPMRMPDGWGRDVNVVPLRDSLVGSARPTLVMLLGAVSLVLLVACVNVATLYAERAAERESEIAVRAALGAGRRRIVRQLLTESVLVASLGAVAGFALAWLGVRVLVALLPAGTPRAAEIAVDLRVVIVTALLALASGIAFGLMPARHAARQDVHRALRSAGRGTSRVPAPRALVVAQLAFAVVLLSAAGLLLESFWRLQRVPLGFRAEQVLVTRIPRPIVAADTVARTHAFYDAVLERVRAIPGVRSAALGSGIPFVTGAYPSATAVEGHDTPPGVEPPLPVTSTVRGDVLKTLGIPLLRGRDLTDADRDGTLRVGLIDAEAAARYWPGEDPLGRRIRFVWNKDWITIVGIVGNVRRDSLSAAIAPSMYLPMQQSGASEMRLVVRTDGERDVAALGTAIRRAVAAVDASVPVSVPRPLRGAVTDSAARPRFTAVLLGTFAAVAVLLGAVGLYGLVAAGVARRRREIGVRLALGASAAGVVRMVVRDGTRVTLAGVVLGLVGAIAAGRALRGLLFDVAPNDPMVLLAVPMLLGVVALVASALPARRAARVDPIAVIRAE